MKDQGHPEYLLAALGLVGAFLYAALLVSV